jgi:hypothetical protein
LTSAMEQVRLANETRTLTLSFHRGMGAGRRV